MKLSKKELEERHVQIGQTWIYHVNNCEQCGGSGSLCKRGEELRKQIQPKSTLKNERKF